MKLIILKNNLVSSLGAVEKAVNPNSNLPILKNIFLGAKNGKILLAATNLELGIKSYFTGKVMEDGETTVPFVIFNNIIKNLPTDRVQLELKKGNLSIKSDNYEASINVQPADDFPTIPVLEDSEKNIIFKTGFFKDVVSKIINATQFSEIRPEISGLCLKLNDGVLKFVATDSFRLAEKTVQKDQYREKSGDFEIIIPFKTIQEILKIIGGEGDLQIFFNTNQILFKTENQEIISRLVSGNFPDYQGIIPKESKTEIIINRSELVNAVKLTSVFASRASDIVLKSGENSKFFEIYAGDSQLGENRSLLPAKIKGDNFSVIFNWRYFLDGLRIMESEEVVLSLTTPDRPMMIKNPNAADLFYLVMPIRV